MAPIKPKRKKAPLPTREEILRFIAESPNPVGKREISRAFKVAPADRVALKGLLKEIERSGSVERGPKRRLAPIDGLPEVGVVEIAGTDIDGDLLAKPLAWRHDEPPPKIYVIAEKGAPALAAGERAAVKFRRLDAKTYEARVIRSLGGEPDRVLGVFRSTGEGGRIEPSDRRVKNEFRVLLQDASGAQEGEIVWAEVLRARRMGLPQARVIERIGDSGDPKSISLIAIHAQGIPTVFPSEAIKQAEAAKPVTVKGRTDLRDIPLVTIDGSDARDFDDAVWAEPDPEHEGGWHLLVAIADVAWYVRPGDALDREAFNRGNSVYFPDRVVPMLPEALSNELCSLKPAVPRACLAVHMWIDAEGRLRRYQFVRGLMRSAARLTYEQAQAAIDGRTDDTTGPLLESVIKPLYAAYRVLDRARQKRGALDLDLPERRIVLDEAGKVASIQPRERLDSHKLIEEFMITANVAAAEALEAAHQPCMYRVHDRPDEAKIASLRDFLEGIGIPGLSLAKGQAPKPAKFNEILHRAADSPYAPLINELVLRSQSQAVYSPENLGHFGLALRRYAHFTSPIRRYSDLLVHRALIAAHPSFGAGGLAPTDPREFAGTGEHISGTERRAALAERDAGDRYATAFLADRVGAQFTGRVNGVTRAGLFVVLSETGASGLLPMGNLPADYYVHDEAGHRLVGRRWGRVFRLGDQLTVRLAEADPATGSLLFELVSRNGDEHILPSGRKDLRPNGPAKGKSRKPILSRRR